MTAPAERGGTAEAAHLRGLTPPEVAQRLSHLPGLVFFDSAGHLPASARHPVSIVAAQPRQVLTGHLDDPADRARLSAALAAGARETAHPAVPPGGLCGWITYEGCYVFGEFPDMLVHLHDDASWWETGHLSRHLRPPQATPAEPAPEIGGFTPLGTPQSFRDGVRRIKEWIAAGDIYQANLSQAYQASVTGSGSLFPLYLALRDASPAPMAAWLSLAGTEVLSSSPETFLKFSGRQVETRPIKGTRPRFADPAADQHSAQELRASPKEAAELVMITDLLRNDLGQVCTFGSVKVAAMLELESLAQVHHLVSTVTGTLRDDLTPVDALHACFPGGSITGTPKRRAMEIIRCLEPTPRGLYCGCIGWLGFNSSANFNIAIRTLVRQQNTLRYAVGAGIVADSDPHHEFEETQHKAAGIRMAITRWHTR